jgi:ATP-binding cassette subfamily B protein
MRTMTSKQDSSDKGLRHELRVILARGRQVWRLIPARHRWALGGAAALMALTSVVSTSIPLFLGSLVDRVKAHTEGAPDHTPVYRTAAFYLGLIGGVG